jgi:MoaA/NifB/PqqE/SkfB family radical SAM enzyme
MSLPKIEAVYTGKFPTTSQNYFPGWGNFPRGIIEENTEKMMMLDLDFGKICSRKCSCCFRQSPGFKHGDLNEMDYERLCDQIKLAVAKLGLREIKILGAGEPFENKKFLGFLRFLDSLGITVSVFTKGHIIGSDKLAALFNSEYGITTGRELAEELFRLNVGLIVGFNRVAAPEQDKWVGVDGHTELRNRAIEILAEVGFNKQNSSRLAIGCSPTTTENIAEMFDLYKWARRRNIYTVICPTMVSTFGDTWQNDLPSVDSLVELYTKIYQWNIKVGINTLDQLRRDGISAYAGVAPCNQVACGVYVTLDGIVHGCPGDDELIHGDLNTETIVDIWKKSPNRKRAGTYNCGCPAKATKRGKTRRCSPIPPSLFRRVMQELERSEQ